MDEFSRRIAAGETAAFVELYDRIGRHLLQFLSARLNPTDAQDVAQETFSRLLRYRLRLAGAPNPTAYVFRVARNEANRWLARNRRHRTCAGSEAMVQLVRDPATPAMEAEEFARVMLARLDDATRESVVLKLFSGLTFAEVGKILSSMKQLWRPVIAGRS